MPANVACSARCNCFLCRELQSCRADQKKNKKIDRPVCDNFILRKAESSGAMKFIRGAARLSVRHWSSNKDTYVTPRSFKPQSKSTSFEQLYPMKQDNKLPRVPSTERIGKVPEYEYKPIFKMLVNAKKQDSKRIKGSVLNFRRNDPGSNHEKYIPIPRISSPILNDPIYSEPKPRLQQMFREKSPPVYQPMDRFQVEKSNGKSYENLRHPCYDELTKKLEDNKRKEAVSSQGNGEKITQNNNRVVIYFGDSISRNHDANKVIQKVEDNKHVPEIADKVSEVRITSEEIYSEIIPDPIETFDESAVMDESGVIKLVIKESYETAKRLIDMVCGRDINQEANILDTDRDSSIDWSFVQKWRKTPSTLNLQSPEGGVPAQLRLRLPATELKSVTSPSHITVSSQPVKCQSPMSTYQLGPGDLPSIEKDHANSVVTRECTSSSDENRSSGHASMSDSGGGVVCGENAVNRNENGVMRNDIGVNRSQHGVNRNENGPYGKNAAMSEAGRIAGHLARSKHRPQPHKLDSPWPGGGGLEEIRCAIKQLTVRSRDSNSSAPQSVSSGEGRRPRPLVRQPSLDTVCTNVTSADEFVWVDSHNRLVELERVPWTVADIRSALMGPRGSNSGTTGSGTSVSGVRSGSNGSTATRNIAAGAPPRLAYMLQRALVRIARETQRLSQNFAVCTKHEVASAFKIILSAPLAEACLKSCQRAATMFAMSSEAGVRQSKTIRASTRLSVGNFQRWMTDMRLAPFIHEYAAVYMCAGIETLLDEILARCASGTPSTTIVTNSSNSPNIGAEDDGSELTVPKIEKAVANSADLWGLLQPYAHLNAGRIASGALCLSRWTSLSSIGSETHQSSIVGANEMNVTQQSLHNGKDSGIIVNGSGSTGSSKSTSGASSGSVGSVLLTTCVGSACELRSLLRRVPSSRHVATSPNSSSHSTPLVPLTPLAPDAEAALFYFMRCSQLEHSTNSATGSERASGLDGSAGALWSARGRAALPPLAEWLRVACAHADYRGATYLDSDDILQAARLLLAGADCPPRGVGGGARGTDLASAVTYDAAHRLLSYGRRDVLDAAISLLPEKTGLDTPDADGLTPLMKAALAGDEQSVGMLLEAGANPNIESPQSSTGIGATTGGWTALVYGASRGHTRVVERLLAAGAHPDGAACNGEHVATLTPLQVACGAGDCSVVRALVAAGAQAFAPTGAGAGLRGARGAPAPAAVAAAHGKRNALRALLSAPAPRDRLSLEDILAEHEHATYTKSQLRALNDAMYHAAETQRLDVTIELRSHGVSWTLHTWMSSLGCAYHAGSEDVIDNLLQDFLQVCPTDDSHYSKAFIYECLPLLFNIFRNSKKEGTLLLLADALCTVYGWQPPALPNAPPPAPRRALPDYLNNPDLSDVTFRVEGRLFYGHKIVLVSESARLRAMLTAPSAANSPHLNTPPTVHIDDIRYHVFQHVMKYLYSGGCSELDIPETDVLEVLAAASYFQLVPLQRFCESRAASTVDLHNLVSVYIHAKVYNARHLLQYCQGFLLQNMVALLTYDDSTRRLLIGSRLPGHDVLSGLLRTLQHRVEQRKRNKQTR